MKSLTSATSPSYSLVILCVLVFMAALVLSAPAATFVVDGDEADNSAISDGGIDWNGQETVQAARVGGTVSRTAVLVFVLPDIGSNVVTDANLFCSVNDNMWDDAGDIHADLYGVRTDLSSVVLGSDHYLGPLDTGATLIQDDIFTTNTWGPVNSGGNFTNVNTSAAGDTELAAWLQSIYDADASAAGKYVFLRYSLDALPGLIWHNYTIASANHTNEATPVLTVETGEAPPPAGILVPIDGSEADNTALSDGSVDWNGQQELRAGKDGSPARTASAVLVFELPDLGAGYVVSNANLSLMALDNVWGDAVNGDLYAVRTSSSSNVVTSDEYTGTNDVAATLIQDDWLTPELTPGPGGSPVYTEVNTSNPGDAALAAWLQAQYDGGAVAGDFVFLRVSADGALTDWYRYVIAAADSTNHPAPVLTIDKVQPPPAGILVPIDGSEADNTALSDGSVDWNGQQELRAGKDGSPARTASAVLVFELPDLGAGYVVSNANLSLMALDNVWGDAVNGDLYAVRTSSSSNVVTSDEYTGPLDAGATLIQDDWLTPELTPGPGGSPVYTEVNTSNPGDAALAGWLQAQYDGGAVAGDFAFLRVSVDGALTDWYRYAIAAADSTNHPAPVLTIDKVQPPPAGILVPIDGSEADNTALSDGSVDWNGQQELRAGKDGSPARTASAVLVFELPDLGAGYTVANANLSLMALDNMWSDAVNGDLYAVRTSSSSNVVTSDEYTGPLDAGATLIQDDWLTPELTPGPGGSPVYTEVNTSTSGGAALAGWLQTQYDGGATAGDFVFLRVSVDSSPTDWFRYAIASADSTNHPTPVLTIDKVAGAAGFIVHTDITGPGSVAPSTHFTVQAGSTTQVVFTADTWYEIESLTTNGVSVAGAVGELVYTAVFANVQANVSNVVAFTVTLAPVDGKTPATWYGPLGANPNVNDEDFDGLSLYEEYLINTDPVLTFTVFEITSFVLDGSQKPVVTWNSLGLPNGTLVVQDSTDLPSGSWNPVSGSASFSAGTTTWTGDAAVTGGADNLSVDVQE